MSTSIDPAVSDGSSPEDGNTGFAYTTRLEIKEGQVYAFDFDGVLSSPFEDAVYKMPFKLGDDDLVCKAAKRLSVDCAGMELRYQRHLVYQAALFKLGVEIAPGPALKEAGTASRFGPVFVISARSGWFAVERMRRFFVRHGIVPVEVFNVGRVTKEKQIALLSKEFKGKRINFVEDSIAHLEQIARSGISGIDLILVGDLVPTVEEARQHFEWSLNEVFA